MSRPSIWVYLGVASASGAGLLVQVSLTRVLSITLWHHFAYLVIGIALLGFGAAGSWLATRRRGHDEPEPCEVLARRAALASLASLASLAALSLLRFDSLAVFSDAWSLTALALTVGVAAVPFAGVGVLIGTSLTAFGQRTGAVYAADLIGASLGALGSVLLLETVGGGRALVVGCGLLAAAGCAFARHAGTGAKLRCGATLAFCGLCLALYGNDDTWIAPAPGKEIRPLVNDHRAWTAQARIDVSRPFAATPAMAADVADPGMYRQRLVTQDGAAPTALFELEGPPAELEFFARATTSAVWQLRGATLQRGDSEGGPRVLVIGLGGGVDVLMARAFGAGEITGVEVNAATLALHTKHFASYSRIASLPGVQLVNADGRAFLQGTKQTWDVIQLSGVDTFTALASGAYSLAEAYVYTLEAFEDYHAHLSETGCLSIARLALTPPRETFRLAATALEAWQIRGAGDPWRHIAVISGPLWGNLVACRAPIDAAASRRFRKFARDHGFRVLFDGQGRGHEHYRRLLMSDAQQRPQLLASYPYRIDPATDEAPFFFDYFRWSQLFSENSYGHVGHPYAYNVPVGHRVLLATFAVTLLLAVVGILLPLRGGTSLVAGRQRGYLAFFGALGTAFLFVEIALVQRLTLLLGHPTYALIVVLGGLLAAAGLGSALSRGLPGRSLQRGVGASVVVATLGAGAVSAWAVPHWLGFGFGARLGLSLALIAPLGVAMGMPFPLGLDQLRSHAPALVPWAFGVNAFFTVIAASLSTLLAMAVGFSWLFVAASAVYAAGFLCLARTVSPPASLESPGS